jgi:hypothetical protein
MFAWDMALLCDEGTAKLMHAIRNLFAIVIHPRRTARLLAQAPTIHAALTVVLVFGAVVGIMFLVSYLAHDYPPPPAELRVWIDTWGEFAMLPFLAIPAEHYRLFLAFLMVPLALAVWILMAGSARVLSALFGGKVSFDHYLNVFAFSFFVFWILGTIIDTIFSGLLGSWALAALRMEQGPLARSFAAYFMPIVWPAVLILGGIYNGIAMHELERFPPWKVAVVALATCIWPIVLISALLR